jgi:uncharacterized protein YijF (DUF1287 family)
MSRSRSGFYSTIEYIGPRPIKPKRPNIFGGWVIIVIAAGIGFWFASPLLPFLKAANVEPTPQRAATTIATLEQSKDFGDKLAAAALLQSSEQVTYDSSYYKIAYPNGDIAPNKGMAADVIIRAYRKLNIDLQVLVHEDMEAHFRLYPGLWNGVGTDPNIDHRRIANLQCFFERKGEKITASRDAADYHSGDIVIWTLGNGEKHIGIVVPAPSDLAKKPWVVGNMGIGVKWENILFDYKIERHFRYPAETSN